MLVFGIMRDFASLILLSRFGPIIFQLNYFLRFAVTLLDERSTTYLLLAFVIMNFVLIAYNSIYINKHK